MPAILETSFLDNTLIQITASIAVIVISFLFRKQVAGISIGLLENATKRTKSELDDILVMTIKKPFEVIIFIAGIYIGIKILSMPKQLLPYKMYVSIGFKLIIIIVTTWLFFKITDSVVDYLDRTWQTGESGLDKRMAPVIQITVKTVIVVIAIVTTVQNMGYSVSGLMAGLGIGGLAFALAAKDTLSNYFGAMVILADHPFSTGDTIRTGGITGAVEQIGFRSTRLRAPDNTVISIPNGVLANTVLENLTLRRFLRHSSVLNIPAGVPSETVASILAGIESELSANAGVLSDSCKVRFTGINPTGMAVLIEYAVETRDTAVFLKIQQEINMAILVILEKNGVGGKYPYPSVDLMKASEIK